MTARRETRPGSSRAREKATRAKCPGDRYPDSGPGELLPGPAPDPSGKLRGPGKEGAPAKTQDMLQTIRAIDHSSGRFRAGRPWWKDLRTCFRSWIFPWFWPGQRVFPRVALGGPGGWGLDSGRPALGFENQISRSGQDFSKWFPGRSSLNRWFQCWFIKTNIEYLNFSSSLENVFE